MPTRSKAVPSNNTFSQNYVALCQVHSLPISAEVLTPQLDSESLLVLDVTRIKRDDDWVPVIKTLRRDASLRGIVLFCNQGIKDVDRDQIPQKPIQKILIPLLGSIRELLSINRNITKLHINGIYLSNRAMKLISSGLAHNKSISDLSFARSGMGESGLWILSPTLKSKVQCLRILNLSDCNITAKGAFCLANILKSQFVKRQAIKWEQSLRGNCPSSEDDFTPLQRITLNSNSIGDEGIDILMDLLSEQIGLIALDLQDNDITLNGAKMALSVLELNKEIQILDIRNNSFGKFTKFMIDSDILNEINRLLFINKTNAKEISQVNNIPSKEWFWHEGDPLDHTFFKAKASERVRINTASATARRRVSIPQSGSIQVKNDRSDVQKQKKKATMFKSIHKKTALMIPLKDSNVKIEPSRPCHVLKLYKKEEKQDVNSLKKENSLLRERLRDLESGIVKVSHVLKDNQSFSSLPCLPGGSEEEIGAGARGTAELMRRFEGSDTVESEVKKNARKSKKKKKKNEDIKQLLMVVEESLAHLTKVLDKIQHKKG